MLSHPQPEDWLMQKVPRSGAPPLRFKGQRLFHHGTEDGRDTFFVTLWARKKGDYVVAYSELVDGAAKSQAVVADSMEAGAAHLEAFCAEMMFDSDVRELPFDTMIRSLGYRQQFPRIVGTALADWDAGQGLAPTR